MDNFYVTIAVKSRKSDSHSKCTSKFRKFIRASSMLKCTSIVTSSEMHIYEIHFRRKLRMQLLRFEEPVAIKFHRAVHLLDSFTLYTPLSTAMRSFLSQESASCIILHETGATRQTYIRVDGCHILRSVTRHRLSFVCEMARCFPFSISIDVSYFLLLLKL